MNTITEKNNIIEKLQADFEAIPTYTEAPKEKIITLYQALDYIKHWETYPGDLLDINIFLKSIIKRIEVYPDTKHLEVIWAGAPDTHDEWKFNKNSVIRKKKDKSDRQWKRKRGKDKEETE